LAAHGAASQRTASGPGDPDIQQAVDIPILDKPINIESAPYIAITPGMKHGQTIDITHRKSASDTRQISKSAH
jgi:hypothetical protein